MKTSKQKYNQTDVNHTSPQNEGSTPFYVNSHTPFFTKRNIIQKKCAECEEEEKLQKKSAMIQMQEEEGSIESPTLDSPGSQPPTAESSTTESPTSETGVSSTTVEGPTNSAQPEQQGQFIVEDSETPSVGQMRKSDFLERLNAEVCASVDDALKGSPFSSDNCPYIRSAFARYKNSTALQLEQTVKRYEPATRSAQSADDIIQQVKTHVSTAASRWLQTGDLSDVPKDIADQIPDSVKTMVGMASAIGSATQSISSAVGSIASGIGDVASGMGDVASSVGDLLFKSNEGVVHSTQSPHAVMQNLGKGHSLDGGSKTKMESAFGTNFSDVEVHNDSNAANLSRNMNARAFTVGNHIAFASGEHKPGTLVGDALMAHELAHVQQQSGMNNSDHHSYDSLEKDADDTAVGIMTKVMTGKDVDSLKKGNKGLKAGLRLSRCKSKSNPAPSPTPTPTPTPTPVPTPTPTPSGSPQTQLTSGGISGLVLNATFTVSNTPCQTLQIIQVFWGTRREDNLRVGTMTFTENGKTYDAFVDGGKNSPFVTLGHNPPADANKPYYLTQAEHAGQVSFSNSNGTITTFDQPGAVAAHKEAFFETAVVCVNHNNTGVDKILTVFKWGWTALGTTPVHSGGVVLGGTPTGIQTSSSPSARFGQIISNDYPGYTFN